jgi:hypothetical protein
VSVNEKTMNKVVIVGHPTSGYEEVEALLHQCGVQPPMPSRHEKLLPQDITATLCKAHKVPPLDTFVEEEDIVQIEAGPVWHGMALDLMLGNLDQQLWGWADPQTIHALHYWATLDPKLGFVLVYDEPHRVLMAAARTGVVPPSAHELTRLLDNWSAYNGAMLRFYLRHPGRCLLFHAHQAQLQLVTCVQQLEPMLDAPLLVPDAPTISLAVAGGDLPAVLTQAVIAAGTERSGALSLLADCSAERFLVEGVLASHPRATQLYAELQSAANLPFEQVGRSSTGANQAWEMWVQQRAVWFDMLQQLYSKYQGTNEELSQLRTRLEYTRVTQARENDRLLDQLYQAQKELETTRLQQREAIGSAQAAVTQAVAANVEVQRQLSSENELLLDQLHQVQKELERYYVENQRLQQARQSSFVPRRYGAADRVKQQLTYRLGARVLYQSKTVFGKLFLLFALLSEVHAYKRDKHVRDQKLPPIQSYADASEADRIRRHLSWRLGLVVRRAGWNPLKWLMLPFALKAETRAWERERGNE